MASAAASFMPSVMAVAAGVERAPEDAREGEHVVDLVRVVAAAGGDDRREAVGLLGPDLGVGVGHGEHDRVGRPSRAGRRRSMRPGPDTPMNTSAPGSTSLSARLAAVGVGVLGEPLLGDVEVVAALPDRALAVAPMISATPASSRILPMATPAAPTPAMTTRRSSHRLVDDLQRVLERGQGDDAVPCWSSWKTGMSSSSLRRSSISKQAGRRCPRG
jgi:hypothetical protein